MVLHFKAGAAIKHIKYAAVMFMNTNTTGAILIADDDRFFRETLARFLRESGYQVAEVARSSEIFDYIEKQRVALCVIDFHIDAQECSNTFVRLRAEYDIPYIIITGDIDPAAQLHARSYSPAFLFFKPVNMDNLLAVIEKIVIKPKPALPDRGIAP